jgi:hypothetical protein
MLSQVHANRIMHPYLTMVGDSSPHNLITGACARCAAPALRIQSGTAPRWQVPPLRR